MVDSTVGCKLLYFLGCYSGYHPIPLKIEDQIKTTFITHFGAFCYTTMPFGLKSVGATYQRGIQKCLDSQIGRNVEAYVNDVVIKTRIKKDLIFDQVETFSNLREFQIKLNPEECMFGVPTGKLLDILVSHRGIEANPEKTATIMKMWPPSCLQDVKKLTGYMTVFNRFISRLGVRGLRFFKLLKK